MKYLFETKEFENFCKDCSLQERTSASIVEKDYWVAHVISSLEQQNFDFELKGGTSLSKGWKIIDRFSEDVDIHIHPPEEFSVYSGKNHDKPKHIESRREFFSWVEKNLEIEGASSVAIKDELSDKKLRNVGIAVEYPSKFETESAVKPYVFLEIGFAQVEPNERKEISAWVVDRAQGAGFEDIKDKAACVKCYRPEYTLVEKLSAIEGKFRQQQENKTIPENFIRHYYDVYQLLQRKQIKAFTKSREFKDKLSMHKNLDKFQSSDAFFLKDKATREAYAEAYAQKKPLYYRTRAEFNQIVQGIGSWVHGLEDCLQRG